MLVNLQANVGPSIAAPILKTFDDVIFCNVGGKSTMSLSTKNIPPMEHNDIPSEILVKNKSTESTYTKLSSFNKTCLLSALCTDEIPSFRFQIIYDGYDFLYYPEFKLYERPYLILEHDYNTGSSIIILNKDSINEDKNLTYLAIGEKILFKDYGTEYTIVNVMDNPSNYEIYLDRDTEEEYYSNDLIVFPELKYELQESSNILNDSTINTLSPFKLKFINDYESKSYLFQAGLGQSVNYILDNSNTTAMVDLWGDDKYASLSHQMDITIEESLAINANITGATTVVEFTAEPPNGLQIGSYFTVKSSNGIEIIKVTEILSDVMFTVERGQLGTTAVEHTSAEALVYLPKYVYFILLPLNKELTKRYVAYRNIDFVLTWV